MKNKDLEDLKPVYIQDACYSSDDEISLVDLALVLMHRKMLIGFVLTAFVVLGLFFSMPQKSTETATYDYETSIFIGSRTVNNSTVYLEPPATLLSNIQYNYIPKFLADANVDTTAENKYTITAELPKDSGIITLKTSREMEDDAKATQLLNAISSAAIADHGKYYESIKSSLSSSIKNRFSTPDNPVNLTDLSLQLTSLKASSTLEKPQMTEVISAASSKSVKFILVILVFSGLFVGVFAAFFAEFISKVKEASQKDKA